MAEVTTLADVASRLGRPLTTDERELADTLIGDAENLIRSRVPGRVLDAEHVDLSVVRQVAGNAVVRVLRNPDGYRSEAAGGVSYTIDTRAAAGFLTILADEWSLLGLSGSASSAGSFAPRLGTPVATGPALAPWSAWL